MLVGQAVFFTETVFSSVKKVRDTILPVSRAKIEALLLDIGQIYVHDFSEWFHLLILKSSESSFITFL
jgi:hypothetical protein